MLQAPNGATRAVNFPSNDTTVNSSPEVESKYSPAASEFQTSPDLNQRLSWGQQPLTSPGTSEAGGYPHGVPPHQAQPHQSFLPHHNPYNPHHGGQPNYGLQNGYLQQAQATAAGLYNVIGHAAGTSPGWPPQPPTAPIHVNYIMNSNVIHNYRPPQPHAVPAYYPTQ